jgi:hypothetical protein
MGLRRLCLFLAVVLLPLCGVTVAWADPGASEAGAQGQAMAVGWGPAAAADDLMQRGTTELMLAGSIVDTEDWTSLVLSLMAGYTLGGGPEIAVVTDLLRANSDNWVTKEIELGALFIHNLRAMGRIVPFLQGGGGFIWESSEFEWANGRETRSRTDPRVVLGGGVRFFFSAGAAMVLQYRFERTFLDSDSMGHADHSDRNGVYAGIALYP